MSDKTTLLPCPFCGGEASVKVLEYDDCKVWGVFCESDLESEYSHGHFVDNYPTEAEAIAAWNTRATHGTLTAEQVREAIKGHSLCYGEIGRYFHDASWQAIADKLNAELGSGTCEFSPTTDNPPTCSNCGWQADAYDCDWLDGGAYEYDGRFCKSCGALVRKAVER